jgi:hypothetical protein
MFGAKRFRPRTDEASVCHASRPRRGEHARVLHDELDLQSFLGCVRVDGAPSVGRIGPIYGTVLRLGFGSGFAIDQAVAFDDMQRLAMGVPKASTVENGATLMPTVSITRVSPS